ncbi:MAG: hypothetical protein AAF668_02230 [Pseudomonadota bacterium]
MFKSILIAFVGAALSACVYTDANEGAATSSQSVRPAVITFGSSVQEILDALEGKCATAVVRDLEPSLASVSEQRQIDCEGFDYFGAPRLAEFVFGDDRLVLVWILTEEGEHARLERAFTAEFGPPTHQASVVTAYADDNAGIRKDRPEAGFYAPELSNRYRAFFDAAVARDLENAG